MVTTVYVLLRAGALKGVYEKLEHAQAFYPGQWEEVYAGPIHAPLVWRLGDATILKERVRD
jgi:hypothetical protein